MQTLVQDVRYGWRGLRGRPGFSLLAVLTLALGIGAATTIFSVIQNVLLDPFPYADADRLAAIQILDINTSQPSGPAYFQTSEFLDYQEQNHVFDAVLGGGFEDVLLRTGDGTEQFNGAVVTANTFEVLGVPALFGRVITADDAVAGAPPVFVMAYATWLAHYNMDRQVLGRTFVLNGVPTTLVGIMPPRFTKQAADLWRPIRLDRGDPEISRRSFLFQARLKPGVTFPQASADIELIARRQAQLHPLNYPKQFSVNVVNWIDSLVGEFKAALYTLAAAVGLLLLIACSNVANMLLARASAREREMAIRASLGASRVRLVQQLLVESLLLACGGAVIGCLFAYGGIKALVALIPAGMIPREAVIRLNVPVLAFSLASAIVTALVFGLVPALRAAKRDMVEPLKDSSKGVGGGFRGGRLRQALVIVEVALSLMLLVGAGLLMRSFVMLQHVDLGLNPENILVVRLPLPNGPYRSAAAKHQFFRTLLPRLSALPGVVSVTETTGLPPYGGITSEVQIPGNTNNERQTSLVQLVSEGYFQTLGLRLIRGRLLSDREVDDGRKVAVVNQTLVNRYFGAGNPLGQSVRFTMLENMPEQPVANPVFEIVGVISDAKNRGIQESPMPEAFVPYTLTGAFNRGVLIRTYSAPEALLNSVRREIWALDRNVALTNTGPLVGFLKRFSYAEPRFSVALLGVFAAVGLFLVSIGVYSLIAYTVSRQTHEIGIRMALGAGRADVLRMVAGMGLRLVVAGVAIGLGASLVATRIVASQIWGISPHDPLTLALVVLAMALVGLAACYFPARRATKVDPMVALRCE
jgi:putative ABC transport system permease protein